ASTNDLAAQAKGLYQADSDLTAYYNQTLANGKWGHMMDQTHIGYTYWQEPRANSMPAVKEIELPAEAQMGVSAEELRFDVFNKPKRYIDVYNKGRGAFEFTAKSSAPWIVLSQKQGQVEKEVRIWVSVDWSKAPSGAASGSIEIQRAGQEAYA